MLTVINDIDLENYIKGVVPSEMPASWEFEALKCSGNCCKKFCACKPWQAVKKWIRSERQYRRSGLWRSFS